MKRCPTCNRTYASDEFAFCLVVLYQRFEVIPD